MVQDSNDFVCKYVNYSGNVNFSLITKKLQNSKYQIVFRVTGKKVVVIKKLIF